jgi:hypothetical protein
LQKPRVLHQPKLIWIVLGIIDIAARLAQAIKNLVQNCMRGRVITRRCDSAKILEEQFVASNALNRLDDVSSGHQMIIM